MTCLPTDKGFVRASSFFHTTINFQSPLEWSVTDQANETPGLEQKPVHHVAQQGSFFRNWAAHFLLWTMWRVSFPRLYLVPWWPHPQRLSILTLTPLPLVCETASLSSWSSVGSKRRPPSPPVPSPSRTARSRPLCSGAAPCCTWQPGCPRRTGRPLRTTLSYGEWSSRLTGW